MRRLLLPLFLFFSLPAFAAVPTCYPWNVAAVGVEQTISPENAIKWLSIEGSRASFVMSWFCDEKYGWGEYYFYGYRSELGSNWTNIFSNTATMTKAEADAMWTANVLRSDPRLEAVAARQLDATRPPAIVWRTTAAPVFRMVGSSRISTGERVKLGETCTCIKLVVEGNYCSVEGLENVATSNPGDRLTAGRVALCSR